MEQRSPAGSDPRSTGCSSRQARRARSFLSNRPPLQGWRQVFDCNQLSAGTWNVQRVEPGWRVRGLGRGRTYDRVGQSERHGRDCPEEKVERFHSMSHPVFVPAPLGRRRASPATWKERLTGLKYIPALFRLIWRTHRAYTLGIVLLRIARSVIPVATFWVGNRFSIPSLPRKRCTARSRRSGDTWRSSC